MEVWTPTCTRGRTPCEGGDRRHGDVSRSQGIPKTARKPLASGERHGAEPPSQPSKSQPCPHLDLALPASRDVRQKFCCSNQNKIPPPKEMKTKAKGTILKYISYWQGDPAKVQECAPPSTSFKGLEGAHPASSDFFQAESLTILKV